MTHHERPAALTFASTVTALGIHPSILQRHMLKGTLARVRRGAYTSQESWEAMDAGQRHLMRVLATEEIAGSDLVFSHYAAAALWGLPILGDWPTTVDISTERRSGGRSTGSIRRHGVGVDAADLCLLDGIWLTSPAQTVVDLAKTMPFMHAVAVMDAAAHRKRKPLLTTVEDIRNRAMLAKGTKGWRRSLAAAEFCTDLSDTVWETGSRVGIHILGFPTPILQQRFYRDTGGYDEVDFHWPEYRAIGEFDGLVKYLGNRFRGNLTPEQIVLKEKLREDRLRRQAPNFARWITADVRDLDRLGRILDEAGVPRIR